MKKHISIAALCAMMALSGIAPVRAQYPPNNGASFVFTANPCAVACASWPEKRSSACQDPFPPGSYQDLETMPAPVPPEGKRMTLVVSLAMSIDWDLYLCASAPPHRELGNSTYDAIGPEPCYYHPPFLYSLGCEEYAGTVVTAGQTVIVRGYNIYDSGPAEGRYGFSFFS